MMAFIPGGGAKACAFGCLGFGSCVKACPFGAIDVVNGVAVVDKEACKACGKCVAKCPKHLIELVPYEQTTFVQCSSHAKGKAVTSACEVGCIGCKKCEKTCPNGAITVDNFCAHISVWTQFRKLGTLSFGKSAKSIRKILKLACGSDSEYFAHNADFPELRVTTLPAKFAQTEIMSRAGCWKNT